MSKSLGRNTRKIMIYLSKHNSKWASKIKNYLFGLYHGWFEGIYNYQRYSIVSSYKTYRKKIPISYKVGYYSTYIISRTIRFMVKKTKKKFDKKISGFISESYSNYKNYT